MMAENLVKLNSLHPSASSAVPPQTCLPLPLFSTAKLFPPSMADGYDELLKKGVPVEVSSDEEGLRGSWYTATVLRSRSRRSKKILVEYHRLSADETGAKPLREFVDWILVRPVPPREPPGSVRFAISDEVDAFHNDGWWEGVVTEVLEGSRFSVFFRCSREQIQFNEDELRLHREWVHGEWVPPLVVDQESSKKSMNEKERDWRPSSCSNGSKAAMPKSGSQKSKTRR